jgi:hypothetical protein
MKASKFLASTAATIAVFGSIGLACAQSTTPPDRGEVPPPARNQATPPSSAPADPAMQTPRRSDTPSVKGDATIKSETGAAKSPTDTSSSVGGAPRTDTGVSGTARRDTRAPMAGERPARADRN